MKIPIGRLMGMVLGETDGEFLTRLTGFSGFFGGGIWLNGWKCMEIKLGRESFLIRMRCAVRLARNHFLFD
jgi:hypothetical protein